MIYNNYYVLIEKLHVFLGEHLNYYVNDVWVAIQFKMFW